MGYWIVVVDDDVIELKNAKNLLSEQELKVSCLRSGEDLIKFMEANTPDLVLLDILMPEMDGFESFRALRRLEEEKNRSTTPVIFLTGDNDSNTERRGLKDGASDFIRKPFDKDILIKRIINTIENSKTIETLTEKATLDKLTGFLNKASGTEKIAAMCKELDGALMIFDLDSFKLVNDIYGHDMGDQVLIAFSEIVRRNTRSYDVLSRIGGDEFLGFFKNLTVETAVNSISERLNTQLRKRCEELMGEDFDIPIGISIGVAFVSEDERDFSMLFKCADSAMYRVKQNGKHGFGIYCENMKEEQGQEGTLEEEIARLSQIFEERNIKEEPIILEKDAFTNIYRFSIRLFREQKKRYCKILVSLKGEEQKESISETAQCFLEFMKKELRSCDIVVQVKADQYFIFLPMVSEEEGSLIKKKIEEAFESARMVLEQVSFEE